MSSVKSKRRRLPSKVGTRLTLWGMGVTLAVCAVLCCGLYFGLSISLRREVDSFLEGEVHEFLAILKEQKNESLFSIEQKVRRELGSRSRQDLTFRLLDGTGHIVITSNPNEALPDPWEKRAGMPQAEGVSHFDTMNPEGAEHPIRVCSQWEALPDGGEYWVQATYTLGGVAASLASSSLQRERVSR